MPTLDPAGPEDRTDATAFAGRVARWDPASPVRLVQEDARVVMWADTPFQVLATRSVLARLSPSTVTVPAADLLSGLAISTQARVALGTNDASRWRARLPVDQAWIDVDEVPAERLAEIVRSGTDAARAADRAPGIVHATRTRAAGISPSLLDSPVLTATGGGLNVTIRMRVLFALSGMGFAGEGSSEQVRIRATRAWLRLEARYGAVVYRRLAALPLLV